MNLEELQSINFAISGWAGSGSTSLALLIAKLLKRRYLYIGHVFRYLGERLGYSDIGEKRPEFDQYIEGIVGKTIDNFIDHKLLNSNNIILEGDIAGFRLGRNPKIFSIFVKATYEERLRRVQVDGRVDGEKYLKERDDVLNEKYKEIWGIDFYNEELIDKKYSLVLDNTNMTINQELNKFFTSLDESFKLRDCARFQKAVSKVDSEVEKFWSKGKKTLLEDLKKKGLYYKPEDVILEITQEFPEDIIAFPKEVQEIFLGKK